MRKIISIVLFFLLQYITYSQETEVVIDVISSPLINQVDSEIVNYNDFILTFTNIKVLGSNTFTIKEKRNRCQFELKEQRENSISYRVCMTNQGLRKRMLTFILETKEKKRKESHLAFYKSSYDVHKIKKDSLIEFSETDHPPKLICDSCHIQEYYSIVNKDSDTIVSYNNLMTFDIFLRRLIPNDYFFLARDKVLFKFRVTPHIFIEEKRKK